MKLLLILWVVLIGCGEYNPPDEGAELTSEAKIEEPESVSLSAQLVTEKKKDCKNKEQGALIYVIDDGFYYCDLNEWVAIDLKGDSGADGKDGVDGSDGKDGAPGIDGKDGAPGSPGKAGDNGDNGEKGDDGSDSLLAVYMCDSGTNNINPVGGTGDEIWSTFTQVMIYESGNTTVFANYHRNDFRSNSCFAKGTQCQAYWNDGLYWQASWNESTHEVTHTSFSSSGTPKTETISCEEV